jgi:ribosomal protein S18 acetylase RimI-like enzyme
MNDVVIRAVETSDAAALKDFFARIPEGDRTFFKEDMLAPGAATAWAAGPRGRRLVATTDDATVVGCVGVIPGVEWSSHVAEIRLVVDPGRRRQGIGRGLARQGLLAAIDLGMKKIVVEVVADQAPAVAMFQALGFQPEALLRDHVCDRAGHLRDLMVLSHLVDDRWAELASAGIADAVG